MTTVQRRCIVKYARVGVKVLKVRGTLRIGELAELCGVSTRTVDYYTRLGLLTPAKRTDGNFRLYEPQAAQRLLRVKQLQERRYSLREIRECIEQDGTLTEVSTLREIRRQLQAIHHRLQATDVRAHPNADADSTLLAEVRIALELAVTVSDSLRELAEWETRQVEAQGGGHGLPAVQ